MAVSRLHADGDMLRSLQADLAVLSANPKVDGLLQRLASLTQPAAKSPVVLVRLVGQLPALRDFVLKGLAEGLLGEQTDVFPNVQAAVDAIGPDPVREIALFVCYRALCAEAMRKGPLAARDVMRHGLAAASGMRLMRFYAKLDSDDVFAVGLLHNLGAVGLASARGKGYEAALAAQAKDDLTLAQAEREAFGFDHQDLGASLLEAYGFLPAYVDAAGSHHAPLRSPARHTETMYLCGTLAEHLGCSIGPAGRTAKLTQADAQRFTMAPGGLEKVAAAITTAIGAFDRLGI